ncbi:hypothetical protein ABL78_7456, partial [Leptomonas seymouri]
MHNPDYRKIDGHLDSIEGYLRAMVRAPPPSLASRQEPPALAPLPSVAYNTFITVHASPLQRDHDMENMRCAGPLPQPSLVSRPPPFRPDLQRGSNRLGSTPATASAAPPPATSMAPASDSTRPPRSSSRLIAPPLTSSTDSSSLSSSDDATTQQAVWSAASWTQARPIIPSITPPPSHAPRARRTAAAASTSSALSPAVKCRVSPDLSSEEHETSSLPSSLDTSRSRSMTSILDRLEQRFHRTPSTRYTRRHPAPVSSDDFSESDNTSPSLSRGRARANAHDDPDESTWTAVSGLTLTTTESLYISTALSTPSPHDTSPEVRRLPGSADTTRPNETSARTSRRKRSQERTPPTTFSQTDVPPAVISPHSAQPPPQHPTPPSMATTDTAPSTTTHPSTNVETRPPTTRTLTFQNQQRHTATQRVDASATPNITPDLHTTKKQAQHDTGAGGSTGDVSLTDVAAATPTKKPAHAD